MSVFTQVPLVDQIAEVHREIEMRKRVYPRLIAQQKLTAHQAGRQMTMMVAALHTLEYLRDIREAAGVRDREAV
jgi:hypothetical protein